MSLLKDLLDDLLEDFEDLLDDREDLLSDFDLLDILNVKVNIKNSIMICIYTSQKNKNRLLELIYALDLTLSLFSTNARSFSTSSFNLLRS
jgi:hypothetical protein